MTTEWSEELDAVAAAPDSHRVLLENGSVRVLEVIIPPGAKEPPHTHRWPSVMHVLQRARILYYGADGTVEFESPEVQGQAGQDVSQPQTEWMEPEGLHAVENIDTRPYRAIRVEVKDRPRPTS